jgi:YHS domain-containing protein
MLRQKSIMAILFIALFAFGASIFAQEKSCAADSANCTTTCGSKMEEKKDVKTVSDSKMADKKHDKATCDSKKDGKKCDPAKCDSKKDGKKCDPAKCDSKKDGKKCDPAKCDSKKDGKKCDPAKCDSKMTDKKDAKTNCDSKMTDKKGTKKEAKKGAKKEQAAVKAWNKVCPVMGEDVDPEAPTTTYKGKVIGFCCAGCDKKFQKEPEKYMKNLSEDGTKFLGAK